MAGKTQGGNRWKARMRKAIVGITPPVVFAAIRKSRMSLPFKAPESRALRQPADYSTLDNPLEVPCQVESYLLCRDKYLRATDTVLDVGFGLGYGLQMCAAKARELSGIETDARAVARGLRVFDGHPRIRSVAAYDGKTIPFPDSSFDAVMCVEVLEHVADYEALLLELVRVARRMVFLTTPNRCPESTQRDGTPKNYWHLREWTWAELAEIFANMGLHVEWNFLNGRWEGPFRVEQSLADER